MAPASFPKMRTLYVLESPGPRFYVGVSANVPARLAAHNAGAGAAWTRGSRWRVARSRPVAADVAGLHEDLETLALMRTHGPDAVRGGQFVRRRLPSEQIRYIQTALRHNDGLCVRCGAAGHWVAACVHADTHAEGDHERPAAAGWFWLAVWCVLWVMGSCGVRLG